MQTLILLIPYRFFFLIALILLSSDYYHQKLLNADNTFDLKVESQDLLIFSMTKNIL